MFHTLKNFVTHFKLAILLYEKLKFLSGNWPRSLFNQIQNEAPMNVTTSLTSQSLNIDFNRLYINFSVPAFNLSNVNSRFKLASEPVPCIRIQF
jgi:hypothetical protein